MKKSYIKILITLIIMLAILIFNSFVLNIFNNTKLIIFLLLIFTVLYFSVGFEKSRHRFVKDIYQVIIIFCLVYLLIIYISGAFLGFTRTIFDFSIISIIKNLIPVLILIIIKELIRYNVVVKCKNNILIIIMLIICLVFSDITILAKNYSYTNIESLIKMLGIVILPSITRNIVLTYITSKVGYKPCIIYRLLLEASISVIPIYPDLGIYLQSILDTCFPVLLYFDINKLYKRRTIEIYDENKTLSKVIVTLSVIIIFVMTFLVCNLFKYYIMAIGSKSMTPNINKGDAVIIEKLSINELKTLKEGNILAFSHDNKVYVHRIININFENNEYSFQTKGDNNKDSDPYIVYQKYVVGKVVMIIPFIGIPTVELSEMMTK